MHGVSLWVLRQYIANTKGQLEEDISNFFNVMVSIFNELFQARVSMTQFTCLSRYQGVLNRCFFHRRSPSSHSALRKHPHLPGSSSWCRCTCPGTGIHNVGTLRGGAEYLLQIILQQDFARMHQHVQSICTLQLCTSCSNFLTLCRSSVDFISS